MFSSNPPPSPALELPGRPLSLGQALDQMSVPSLGDKPFDTMPHDQRMALALLYDHQKQRS